MSQLNEAFLDDLAKIGPIGKTLSMLVRPAFVAAPGKRLVWGDWSAIEARVLPWLAASPSAEKVLDIFRESDHDKSKPDIYMRTACDLIGEDAVDWWDAYRGNQGEARKIAAGELRQSRGKVPVLSLGFGGGLGALQAMAINYGVFLDDAKAQEVVERWRATNPWARQFWGKHDRDGSSGLWGAANRALENPGDAFAAGRVAYVYDPGYLGGTLFCALPCGRLLSYPDIRYRTRTFKDKTTQEDVEKHALWFKKGYGWSALWFGKLAENVTQAVAGSILRETLVELEDHDPRWETIGSTHDEVVLECSEQDDAVAAARQELEHVMGEWRPDWRKDLPLVAEVTDHGWYSKAV